MSVARERARNRCFNNKMSEFVIAETEYGKVRGVKKLSALNDNYYSFMGIPYATPPLGSLRFKVRLI